MLTNPKEILLAPRKVVGAGYVGDAVYSYQTSRPINRPFPKPLMKCRDGEIHGYVAGRRSFIPFIEFAEGNWYKIKGCGLDNGPIDVKKEHTGEPEGGLTLETAREELRNTDAINKFLLRTYNCPNCTTPFAWFRYKLLFNDEPTGASVHQIKGDTRFDEFLQFLHKKLKLKAQFKGFNYQLFRDRLTNTVVPDILQQFGVYAGSLLGAMHANGLYWGTNPEIKATNSHIGNFVVFSNETGLYRLGIVDFDSLMKKEEYNGTFSTKQLEEIYKLEIDAILEGSVWRRVFSSGNDEVIGFRITREAMHKFNEGFESGYKDPTFEPIALHELL